MERYIFVAEWYQVEASMTRPLYLYFYPADKSVELFDHKSRRTFLRRTRVEEFTESDFYIGAKLNIFGRQIDILDYGDSLTRNKVGGKRSVSFAIIQPEAMLKMGEIIQILTKNDLKINQCIMVKLSGPEAVKFYEKKAGQAVLPFMMENIISGPILAMELIADDAFDRLSKLCGPVDSTEARDSAPHSIRAQYGIDNVKNAIHCSETRDDIKREIDFFFRTKKMPTTEQYGNCTLGIIKPHAVKEGKVGDIISMILSSGLTVTALKMVYMDRVNCEEFLEVYKSVVPEYVQMALALANGPCIAMELSTNDRDVNAHSTFRLLCGPVDPEVGQKIRPKTIRAKFGKNKVLNAIHCTDLPEDAHLEVEYLFKILT